MDRLWELRDELSEHNDTVGATTDAVYTQESFVNAFNLVCHEDKMTEEEQLLRCTGTACVTYLDPIGSLVFSVLVGYGQT